MSQVIAEPGNFADISQEFIALCHLKSNKNKDYLV